MRLGTRGLILAGMMAGGISGAGEPESRTIVTTFYPMQIAVMNITAGVAGIRVVNLASPGIGCPHDYQPTTRDLVKLAKADVVVANGGGMESYLETVARRWPGKPVIDASVGLSFLCRSGQTNAHVWLSPARHIRQVQTIAGGLAAWDPRHGEAYRQNAAVYVRKLEGVRRDTEEALKDLPRRDIITFHEAFEYFADDYHLKVVAVIEREPGTEPAAGELASLIRLIKNRAVKALFIEPQYPAKPAEVIARETGAGLYTLDPVVSGEVSPDAYLRAMGRNAAELKHALGQ